MTQDALNTRWVEVASVDDVPEGEVIGVTVEGHEIALYHLPDGSFHATANICTHGQALLSEGWLADDCMIECPLHAGCFDIRTGKGMGPPIEEDLQTYRLRREGDALLVEIPD
ncbi:non-heme iron oxygenase ferredoxin subunit [Chelatococcus sp. GCM10030263]|uniref:non-heme iron oxygenase ferredoxin subunit n=1 Tax=Chelatococcus sp. GCM10030263 TaxID=3273387 RepID=UPI00362272DF